MPGSETRSRSRSRSPHHERDVSRSRSRSEGRVEERGRYNDESNHDDNRKSSRTDARGESNSVLVRNLNYRTSPEELKKAFSEFGDVGDVYLPLDYYSKRPRGFGFVQFRNGDDAHAACKAMDQTEIDGNKIEVVIAKQNRKSPTTMRKIGGKRNDDRYDDRSSRRDDRYSDRRGYRESRDSRRRSRSRSYDDRRRDRDYESRRRDYDRKDRY